ncbi:hypothetical protein ERJ75_001126400 [Trypanosoma vivax]|nr:hypothetical protein ERJ75_001126400 [Trypanosoma vivax]
MSCPPASTSTPSSVGNDSLGSGEEGERKARVSLREKYEALKSMRHNELQEGLARERLSSYIVCEVRKSKEDSMLQFKAEREAHARESFYLIKENEWLKQHVKQLEANVVELQRTYENELALLRERADDLQDRLIKEREEARAREAISEQTIQRMVNNLYVAQTELERLDEANKQMENVKQKLYESEAECAALRRTCELLQVLSVTRETFIFSEKVKVCGLYGDHLLEHRDILHRLEGERLRNLELEVVRAMAHVQEMGDMHFVVKQLLLTEFTTSVEKHLLTVRYESALQELSQLDEERHTLTKLLESYKEQLKVSNQNNAEAASLRKSVDDTVPGYVLMLCDAKIEDRVAHYKRALHQTCRLMAAMLKRYEPFQRGDEYFTARVTSHLNSVSLLVEDDSM